MSCQGFYRGTSHDQVPFFANKEKKMIETKKWPDEFEKEVDMNKVNVSVISSWITKRITEILGFEDEIIIDYCRQQLLPQTSTDVGSLSAEKICPKKLQINMTGFLAKNASSFVKDLWSLLLDAQESESGIPSQFVEEQKNEMMFKQAEAQRIKEALEKVHKVKNSQNVLQENEQNNNETNSKTTFEPPLNEGIDDRRLFNKKSIVSSITLEKQRTSTKYSPASSPGVSLSRSRKSSTRGHSHSSSRKNVLSRHGKSPHLKKDSFYSSRNYSSMRRSPESWYSRPNSNAYYRQNRFSTRRRNRHSPYQKNYLSSTRRSLSSVYRREPIYRKRQSSHRRYNNFSRSEKSFSICDAHSPTAKSHRSSVDDCRSESVVDKAVRSPRLPSHSLKRHSSHSPASTHNNSLHTKLSRSSTSSNTASSSLRKSHSLVKKHSRLPSQKKSRSPSRKHSCSSSKNRITSLAQKRNRSPLRKPNRSFSGEKNYSSVHGRRRSSLKYGYGSPVLRRYDSSTSPRYRSPLRRRSRSPVYNRNRVRQRYSRSPFLRRLSPRQNTGLQRKNYSRSPEKKNSRLLAKKYSHSPMRENSRSPVKARSRVQMRKGRRSPTNSYCCSSDEKYSTSPINQCSRLSVRKGSYSPVERDSCLTEKQSSFLPVNKESCSHGIKDSCSHGTKDRCSPKRNGSRLLEGNDSRSPKRMYTRSPGKKYSRSPVSKSSHSPVKKYSRSPVRKYSRSPVRKYSSSPVRKYSRSPVRKYSGFPVKKYSNSSVRKYSSSPLRKYSSSPLRKYSSSPVRKYSSSPVRKDSSSPVRKYSSSPVRKYGRLTAREYSRSTVREYSSSPVRKCNRLTAREYSHSSARSYSRSSERRHSRSTRRKYSRSPIRKYSRQLVRKYSCSPLRRRTRSPIQKRKYPSIKRHSRSSTRRRSLMTTRRPSRLRCMKSNRYTKNRRSSSSIKRVNRMHTKVSDSLSSQGKPRFSIDSQSKKNSLKRRVHSSYSPQNSFSDSQKNQMSKIESKVLSTHVRNASARSLNSSTPRDSISCSPRNHPPVSSEKISTTCERVKDYNSLSIDRSFHHSAPRHSRCKRRNGSDANIKNKDNVEKSPEKIVTRQNSPSKETYSDVSGAAKSRLHRDLHVISKKRNVSNCTERTYSKRSNSSFHSGKMNQSRDMESLQKKNSPVPSRCTSFEKKVSSHCRDNSKRSRNRKDCHKHIRHSNHHSIESSMKRHSKENQRHYSHSKRDRAFSPVYWFERYADQRSGYLRNRIDKLPRASVKRQNSFYRSIKDEHRGNPSLDSHAFVDTVTKRHDSGSLSRSYESRPKSISNQQRMHKTNEKMRDSSVSSASNALHHGTVKSRPTQKKYGSGLLSRERDTMDSSRNHKRQKRVMSRSSSSTYPCKMDKRYESRHRQTYSTLSKGSNDKQFTNEGDSCTLSKKHNLPHVSNDSRKQSSVDKMSDQHQLHDNGVFEDHSAALASNGTKWISTSHTRKKTKRSPLGDIRKDRPQKFRQSSSNDSFLHYDGTENSKQKEIVLRKSYVNNEARLPNDQYSFTENESCHKDTDSYCESNPIDRYAGRCYMDQIGTSKPSSKWRTMKSLDSSTRATRRLQS